MNAKLILLLVPYQVALNYIKNRSHNVNDYAWSHRGPLMLTANVTTVLNVVYFCVQLYVYLYQAIMLICFCN